MEIRREIVDEFIFEGFVPSFDDMPYSFIDCFCRMEAVSSYSRIGNDNGLSSGVGLIIRSCRSTASA